MRASRGRYGERQDAGHQRHLAREREKVEVLCAEVRAVRQGETQDVELFRDRSDPGALPGNMLLEAEVLIYLRGLGFPTDRRPPDQKPSGPLPVPPSGPWGTPK